MASLKHCRRRGRSSTAHRPWPRVVVDGEVWRQAILGIAAGEATLLGMWSDGEPCTWRWGRKRATMRWW